MLIVYAYEKCVLFLHVTKCVTQLCIYIMHLKEYTFFIYIYEISLLFYQLRQVTHFINSAEVASCAQHYLIFCKYVQFSVLLSTNVSLSSAVLDPHVLALDKRKCILEREREMDKQRKMDRHTKRHCNSMRFFLCNSNVLCQDTNLKQS